MTVTAPLPPSKKKKWKFAPKLRVPLSLKAFQSAHGELVLLCPFVWAVSSGLSAAETNNSVQVRFMVYFISLCCPNMSYFPQWLQGGEWEKYWNTLNKSLKDVRKKIKNQTKDWLNKSTPLPLLVWSDRDEAKTVIIAAQKRSLP